MIPIHVDGTPIAADLTGCQDLGALLGAVGGAIGGRVITGVVLNGWERLGVGDQASGGIPLDLVTEVAIETESMTDAIDRALESAGALASVAAQTAARAGDAFQSGRDGEGHLGFGELCRFADDLQAFAETLRGVVSPGPAAEAFVAVWEGRCADALRGLVDAGSAGDVVLMSDHLLYEVAPAFEALGAQGTPA